jgi:predicted dehydrogenase
VPPLKTAFIGCGGIARAHAGALANLKQRVQMVAFCDIVRERAQAFCDDFAQGAGLVFTDFAHMLDDLKLDLVYICLPPFAHSNEVELAAARGAHIFIEKPIALNMDLAQRMVAAVERAGVKSQVGFVLRFGAAVEAAKSALASGEAGAPGLMVAKYMCNSPHSPWWRDKSRSGGQVVEQIIHIYDLARFFLGEPSAVYAGMDNIFHRDIADYTVEDVSACVIHFDSGAWATVSATNGAIPGEWAHQFDLITKHRTMRFDNANSAVFHHTDRDWPHTTTIRSDRPMMLAQALDLLDAIESGGETRTPISEGAKSLALVLAVSESAATGKPVQLG